MQEALTKKLYQYISDNNPDLLATLEEKNEISAYLSNKVKEVTGLLTQLKEANKPDYIIEEECMDALTKDLRPSKFDYIKNILEEEFELASYNFNREGTLRYEVINIINQAEEAFADFDFNEENEDNRHLRYAVIGIISDYLSK